MKDKKENTENTDDNSKIEENKPFDVIVHDTKRGIISIMDDSGLPITVLSLILKELSVTISEQETISVLSQRAKYNARRGKSGT